MIGLGSTHGQQVDGSVTGGSWLQSFTSTGSINPVVGWDYFEDQARLSVVSDFGIAVSGVSRTQQPLDAIGLLGAVLTTGTDINPDSGMPYVAWGAYLDAVSMTGSAHGAEINIARLGTATPRGAATPYDVFTGLPMAVGTAIAAGSDALIFGASWPVSALLEFRNNGASAFTGINFRNNVLLREGTTVAAGAVGATGYGRAIAMGLEHGISMYSSTGAESVRVFSNITNDTTLWSQFFNNDAFVIGERVNPASSLFIVDWVADAAAFIAVRAGTSGTAPQIVARGTAANVGADFVAKGSGIAALVSGGGTRQIQASNAGVGFFGTAPVAKPTGVAVSAAGIHAALVTLGLIAA
jgi:hypothetical protein